MTYGGTGLGYLPNGKVVFVPYVIDGELVRCSLFREKKSWAEARLHKILKASCERTKPFCKHFTLCGGCHYQHISYKAQLSKKYRLFSKIIKKVAPDIKVCPIVSSSFSHYRNRIRIFVEGDSIGFYKESSHVVQNLNSCPIATKAINEGIKNVKEVINQNFYLQSVIREVGIFSDVFNGLFYLFKLKSHKNDFNLRPLISCKIDKSRFVVSYKNYDRKSAFLKELQDICFYKGEFAPQGIYCKIGSFYQANFLQNQNLIKKVVELCKDIGGKKIVEFFCGAGNFSIPLALLGFNIIGFELDKGAIISAQNNASKNLCEKRVTFKRRDLARYDFSDLKNEDVDIVILDPPRTGARSICKRLHLLAPKGIIYISCDPMTLQRDLMELIKTGFQPTVTIPFDMFPQTYHIESVTLLEKR